MTPADLHAWIDRHYPGWGGIARASRALGIHRTTLERKLRGEIPITDRDHRQLTALSERATRETSA